MIRRFWGKDQSSEEVPELKGFDDFELRLGDVMRGERATLGKSLLDVQRDLRIKASYIAAIENCDPSAFDTPGFIAGYVRSYARYLGLDCDETFASFCAESGFETAHGLSVGSSVITPVSRPTQDQQSGDPFTGLNANFVPPKESFISQIEPGALGSVAVLLGLVGLIGYGGWSVLQEVQRVQVTEVEAEPILTARLDPLEASDATRQFAENTTERSDALERLYRPEALSIPVLVARDGPIAAVDPRTVGTFNSPAPTIIATAAPNSLDSLIAETLIQVVEEPVPEVVMVAVRPSWVRVRSASGTVIFEKVMDAGEEFILPQTEEAATLRAGESGAIYFAVNGEHYGPAGTAGSVTSGVELSVASLTENYTVADIAADGDLARMVAELNVLDQ
ncbi:helix-turn-helix domain-containing protein [Cochlodiniinecator piscidefendens]|uniref:helix-turn-helix domain-containing protein n=1 Tax=Cochlodiniinecator piscidefendens TaxID=2715756 RepID=UPI00140E2EE8|nr:helix-turn-helix domain-containing protein [Cochlodiniinecator piscidefendens]